MQVRKYLHNSKAVANPKNNKKEAPGSARLTHKKENKKKKQVSKSKSRSRSEKQNSKFRLSCSKSKPRISPLPFKKSNILNNSPNIKKKKLKSKSKNKHNHSARHLPSQNEYDKNSHSISTKLVTDRSPLRTQRDYSPNSMPLVMKKKKKMKEEMKTEIKQENETPMETVVKKVKKLIPKIKTNFSMRKQSYFDPQILDKFQVKNNYESKISARLQSQHEQSQDRTFKYKTEIFREFGTSTEGLDGQRANIKDLQYMRKQQELKWKIMYLELNELKANTTPHKLQEIIYQSERNLTEFQTQSKQIIDSNLKKNYIFESPSKIQKALRRERQSVEEAKSIVKSITDQKLFDELQMIDSIDSQPEGSHILKEGNQNPSSSSFCLEFEKQLEQFTQKHEPFESMEIPHIPQLEYEKANTICDLVETFLLMETSQEIIWNQKLLHGFLKSLKQSETLPKIESNGQYTINLAQDLFQYIIEQGLIVDFLARLNVPFGNSPQVNLKYVRNFFTDESDTMEIQTTPEAILGPEVLSDFDSQKYLVPSQGQYFYNHCVYGCIGELLDQHRPNGLDGLAPLQGAPAKIITNFKDIAVEVNTQIRNILQVRMGRTDFDLEQEDPVRETEKTYELMDRFLVMQEERKWKSNEDNIFENKYFLSATIIEKIINDEVLMLYNEFM